MRRYNLRPWDHGITFFLGLVLWMVPQVALAHSPIKGIGTFYNGILHPLVVPAHLLLLITLGLFAGAQAHRVTLGPRSFLLAITPVLIAVALGLFADMELSILLFSMVLGGLAAWRRGVSRKVLVALSIVGALLVGLDSRPEGLSGKKLGLSLLGTGVGASLALFYLTLISKKAKKKWQQIGVRIVASWSTAAALLVLALRLIKP